MFSSEKSISQTDWFQKKKTINLLSTLKVLEWEEMDFFQTFKAKSRVFLKKPVKKNKPKKLLDKSGFKNMNNKTRKGRRISQHYRMTTH